MFPPATVCTPDWPVELDGGPMPICFSPKWRTETVLALARGIRTDQAFDRMPILADALEEAGCDEWYLLNHCRHCERHVAGCWALDLLYSTEEWFKPDPIDEPATPRVTPFQVVERVSEGTSRVVAWGTVALLALVLLAGVVGVIQFFAPNFLGPKPVPSTAPDWQPEPPHTFRWRESP